MDVWCFQITWYYPRASLACCNIHNPAGKIFSNKTTVKSSLNVYLFVWGGGGGWGGTKKFQCCGKNPTPFPYHHHYQHFAEYPWGDAIDMWVEFVFLIFLVSSESFSAGENQRVKKSYSKNLPPSWVRETTRSCMAVKFALSSNETSPSFPTERKTTTKSKTSQNNICCILTPNCSW